MIDCFDGRKIFLSYPIYKVLRSLAGCHDFLDFLIEERSFGFMDCRLECFPAVDVACFIIFVNTFSTLFIPPLLGVFGDSFDLRMSGPCIFEYCRDSKGAPLYVCLVF